MNILGTGLSGLIGERVTSLLSTSFVFKNLSLETGVDITNKDIVKTFIKDSDAPWVWHFAAYTNVDEAEKDRMLGERSPAWRVNVYATENIVDACRKYKKRLLYVSTDYVFDGTLKSYDEGDEPNPQGWYAITKYEGEKRVRMLGESGLVVRIANPYKRQERGKLDFVGAIRSALQSGQQVKAPGDQLFVPTFIDDIAVALRTLTNKKAFGVYHAVGSQVLSPFDAARKVAGIFGLESQLVVPTTFAEYFHGRAPRPFRAALKNDKILKSGVQMKTFDDGLSIVRLQSR